MRVHDGCGGWSDGEFAYVTVGHAIYIPLPFAKSVPLSDREGDIASAGDDDIGLILGRKIHFRTCIESAENVGAACYRRRLSTVWQGSMTTPRVPAGAVS